MIRAFKLVLLTILCLPIVIVASPLLFWLGRPRYRKMDPDLLEHDIDDPGVSVDDSEDVN